VVAQAGAVAGADRLAVDGTASVAPAIRRNGPPWASGPGGQRLLWGELTTPEATGTRGA
jgi:hypothetical protein